jgi:hypothetical protein
LAIRNGGDGKEILQIFISEMINAIVNKGMTPPPASMEVIFDAVFNSNAVILGCIAQ